MAFIDIVKPWFLSKKKPTQAQFHTLFDYLRFKDQAIAVSDITDLGSTLSQKVDLAVFNSAVFDVVKDALTLDEDGSYTLAAGYLLEKALILPASDSIISIGTGAGLDDISPAQEVLASSGVVLNLSEYAIASRDIHFTGINEGTVIILLKRKLQ